MKVEVGLGSVTKSVIAMCLSNLTADVQNWGSNVSVVFPFAPENFLFSWLQMMLESTVNIEAALFNERMVAWEPLIEPTRETGTTRYTPWCLNCSILPVSILLITSQ